MCEDRERSRTSSMPAKSHQEKLFGAACVYVTLERQGLSPALNEMYLATLTDLGVEPGAVEQFLAEQRDIVESALKRRGSSKG